MAKGDSPTKAEVEADGVAKNGTGGYVAAATTKDEASGKAVSFTPDALNKDTPAAGKGQARSAAPNSGKTGGYNSEPRPAAALASRTRPGMRVFPCAVPLRGVVQHYAWGQPHETSLVAAMATEQVRSKRSPLRVTPLSRGTRFAELWMGTHPNGPSSVVIPGLSMENPHQMKPCFAPTGDLSDEEGEREEWFLKDVISQDPAFWLGSDCQVGDIPYLFKVLSVQQALSIQAHPNKALAERLHKKNPSAYPDSNHKPEICIPLGHFEALCGFRRTEAIREYVREVPELGELCIESAADLESEGIRELYGRLMSSDPKKVAKKVNELIARIQEKEDRSPEENLILRVSKDYPGDVGIFSIFFLNYVRITAEETHRFIYCAPDEPHAYLLGECVECMALSDNVIRAGLTPKFKDVETLLEAMTYRDDLLDELVSTGAEFQPNVVKYDPPVEDFLVYEIHGPVKDGLRLSKAAIAAQVVGSSRVKFVTFEEEGQPDESVSAPQTLVKGYTFFSRAGTTIFVDEMEEGAKLFIATY